MEILEQPRKQVRKEYAKHGERGQKMVTFRLDLENEEWLARQSNRGRYINNLIAADREQNGGQ